MQRGAPREYDDAPLCPVHLRVAVASTGGVFSDGFGLVGASAMIVLFAIFAGLRSAASNLVYVYLPELFPTGLRASGLGLAIAASRVALDQAGSEAQEQGSFALPMEAAP